MGTQCGNGGPGTESPSTAGWWVWLWIPWMLVGGTYVSPPLFHIGEDRVGWSQHTHTHTPNNGSIDNVVQINKAVISSEAEAELGALFINAKEAVHTYQKHLRGDGTPTTTHPNTN